MLIEDIDKAYSDKPPQELLRWAFQQFAPADITLACSLGAEDVVLIDMIVKIQPKARIFILDTGRLHQETYDVLDECRSKYSIEFEVYYPDTRAVETLLRTKGANSFYFSVENRKECCNIRKVEPLKRALAGTKLWITGLRRAQGVTRSGLSRIEEDTTHHNLKLNPLLDWSEEQVWDYIKANKVPSNVLHGKGFPSIGCAPCTRAIEPGEDIRAGRWWWENQDSKECGLHVKK